MRLNRVLLVIRLVEILVFHFLVKIISGNTLENWDIEIERNRKAAAVQFFHARRRLFIGM